jgi:hypothetical protein
MMIWQAGNNTTLKEVISLSYRLQTNEKLYQGVTRIAQEEIDDALNYLETPVENVDEAAHESRKCSKR